jgi:hypothetical protein
MKFTFPLALFLLFLGLKLGGVIAWSWVWVTAPLWVGMAIALIVLLFALVAFTVTIIAATGRK